MMQSISAPVVNYIYVLVNFHEQKLYYHAYKLFYWIFLRMDQHIPLTREFRTNLRTRACSILGQLEAYQNRRSFVLLMMNLEVDSSIITSMDATMLESSPLQDKCLL